MLIRDFELAVICVETGESFGSIRWGYTKTRAGVITLTGAQTSDLESRAATAGLERVRQAFYGGFYQHTLSGFARGSAALTQAHDQTLRSIAGLANLRRVVLVGGNDFSGGPEAAAGLSLRRAQAARDRLVSLGVNASNIEVRGLGVTARVPNPPGARRPANRRVDIRVERGQVGRRTSATGSPLENLRLRRQDPRATLQELDHWMIHWRNESGQIPKEECNQARSLLDALRRWRGVDPSLPDVRAIYGPTLRRLFGRCEGKLPRLEPRPQPMLELEAPSFLERIEEPLEGPPF
jgi:outer membrane protein OmpA-like peptidoglycan-associated protein